MGSRYRRWRLDLLCHRAGPKDADSIHHFLGRVMCGRVSVNINCLSKGGSSCLFRGCRQVVITIECDRAWLVITGGSRPSYLGEWKCVPELSPGHVDILFHREEQQSACAVKGSLRQGVGIGSDVGRTGAQVRSA